MPRNSTKNNLYKNGVDTLSKHMTLKPKSLDENIKHLRSLLSVDTIIDDINQEEALEFLQAVEENIATEREEKEEALIDAQDDFKNLEKEKDEEITSLKNEYDDLMKKTDCDMQFGTIQYRAPGIMDGMIMDALYEAYQLLTPLEIIDRLKVEPIQKKKTRPTTEEKSEFDVIMSTMEEISFHQEKVNELLQKELLRLNPDCETVEDVHQKFNPDRFKIKQEPKEIILSMEALEVLKQCIVENNVVKLPPQQLDRKDYEQVKKKLELIGGKWKGGKVQGFVFKEDPTELLQQIANGEKRDLKQEFQFFATPDSLAEKMVDLAIGSLPVQDEPYDLLEPSAGQGAIVKAINRYTGGCDVDCYEAMPLNQTILHKISTVNYLGDDFLKHSGKMYDAVIANPPFSKNQDIDHIYKMYECLKPGGRIVTIASPSWTFGSQKKQVQFREWLNKLNAHIEEIPEGTFKKSGTNIRAMLLIINKPLSEVISLQKEQKTA